MVKLQSCARRDFKSLLKRRCHASYKDENINKYRERICIRRARCFGNPDTKGYIDGKCSHHLYAWLYEAYGKIMGKV